MCATAKTAGIPAAGDNVNRTILPIPDAAFEGKIGLRQSDSVKDFPAKSTAFEGAPIFLIILNSAMAQ